MEKIAGVGDKKDYLKDVSIKKTFVDESVAVKKKTNLGHSIYKIDASPIEFTKENITGLIHMSDERGKYDIFNTLLLSKKYTHLVLNNKDVLDMMSPLFKKYMPLYRYIIGYAWLEFYLEECIMKTRTTKNSRHVFDMDTASKLPVFPYCSEDLHLNPYFVLSIDSESINASKNCIGLKMISGYDKYGIDTLENFKRKFNIFTTGTLEHNILDGIDWKCCAVSGSAIQSMIQKQSPLMMNYNIANKDDYREMFARFFEELYNGSDIDLMCNKESFFDYMDVVYQISKVIKENLTKMGRPNNITIEPLKISSITIHSDYIKEFLPKYTVEYVREHCHDDIKLRNHFNEIYSRERNKINAVMESLHDGNNPLYDYFYEHENIKNIRIKITDDDMHKENHDENIINLKRNDISPSEVPEDKNKVLISIYEGLRFKIHSKSMNHCIETFQTRYDDFFSKVTNFHLPCVREYFDGDNVYILPSAITAHMTFMNMNYKYFSGVRDPIEIINKYRSRGYGTVLSADERASFVKYNSKNDNHGGIYKIDANLNRIQNMLGGLELTDRMFYPGKYVRGMPNDIYMHPTVEYVTTVQDLYREYKKMGFNTEKIGIDFLRFKTIGDSGYIEPLQKWMIDAVYGLMN